MEMSTKLPGLHQRPPDHLAGISPPGQAPGRQQHVRRPAPPAPRPARNQLPARPVQDPDPPRARVPPPAQHAPARRARQLPARQLPFDHSPVTVYREHDASARHPRPSRLAAKRRSGRAAPVTDVITVPSHTKKDNPEGCPQPIRNVSDANPPLHRHLERPCTAQALTGLASAAAQAGDPDRAEALARTITDPYDQARALTG